MKSDKYEKGLEVRREVLGDNYVDKALSNVNDFNRPMQELVTEYCWVRSGPGKVCQKRPAVSLILEC